MNDLPQAVLPAKRLRAPKRPHEPIAAPYSSRRSRAAGALEVSWAADDDELREAQRLRHLVFAEEMGARLTLPPGTPPGHDADLFDAHCRHLLVRTASIDGERGTVIGTCRLLTPTAAKRVGGLYSEVGFDLSGLQPIRPTMAEMGRTCIHPHHRSAGAILAMWSALAEFLVRSGLQALVGCASVSMCDGGHVAASLWSQLRSTHLADPEWRVNPRLPLPVEQLRSSLAVEVPPLIKGYLRCGAEVLGPPAWDPDFNSADLPMLIRIGDLPARYRNRFIGN